MIKTNHAQIINTKNLSSSKTPQYNLSRKAANTTGPKINKLECQLGCQLKDLANKKYIKEVLITESLE